MCSQRITRICQCLAEVPIEAGVAALEESPRPRSCAERDRNGDGDDDKLPGHEDYVRGNRCTVRRGAENWPTLSLSKLLVRVSVGAR